MIVDNELSHPADTADASLDAAPVQRRIRYDGHRNFTALGHIHEPRAEREHASPYVRYAKRGCLRTSPALPEGADSTDRYLPCDHASLQLWCLTEADYTRCLFYPAGDVG